MRKLILILAMALITASCTSGVVLKQRPEPSGDTSTMQRYDYVQEYHDIKDSYDELMSFKGDPDFHQEGFSGTSPYSQWFEKVTRMVVEPVSLSGNTGPRLLRQLGLLYAGSQGEETEMTMVLTNRLEELLRDLMIDRASLITLAYTGDTLGHVRPIQACCVVSGGLAARAHELKNLRGGESNILLVDKGNVLSAPNASADTINTLIIEAMNRMGYAAMGLGPQEMRHDMETLRSLFSKADFSIVSSNLVSRDESTSWVVPFAVENVGGHAIGILSVQPVPESDDQNVEAFSFVTPEEGLFTYLPKVRSVADTIVLLSNLGSKETRHILESHPDIDLVIFDSHTRISHGQVLLAAGSRGRELGLLQFIPTPDGPKPARHEMLKLDMANVYFDEDMQALVDAALETSGTADP